MKRFAMKSLMMTAAVAALAVGASAQSMNAEIPFSFRAGNAVLAPGTYRINVASADHTVVRLLNVDTKKGAMVVPHYRTDAPKPAVAGEPKLWFACAGSSCVLTTLWSGADQAALVLGSPARHGNEIAETRVIKLTVVTE